MVYGYENRKRVMDRDRWIGLGWCMLDGYMIDIRSLSRSFWFGKRLKKGNEWW